MNKMQIRNIKIASFSVLALSFCSLLVFLSQKNVTLTEQDKAFQRAEIYANKMIEAKFMTKSKIEPVGRGLASVSSTTEYEQEILEGPVGLDPWGRPFHFLVKKSPQNPKTGVLVMWSAGADNKLETSRDMIAEDHTDFKGDDFGKSFSFNL